MDELPERDLETQGIVKMYLIVAIIFALVLVILGGIYFFIKGPFSKDKKEISEFASSFDEGRDLFLKRDSSSVALFEEAVRKSDNPAEEALAKINLGVAHISTDKTLQGVQVLKEVSIQEEYPSRYRAGSIIYALDVYSGTYNEEFARREIFSGDNIWGSFLKEGEGIEQGLKRAYDFANELFPTIEGLYRVAFWYGNRLLEDRFGGPDKKLGQEKRSIYLDQLKVYLTEANKSFENTISQEDLSVARGGLSPQTRISTFRLKGNIYAGLFVVEGKEENKIIAEDSYQSAMKEFSELSGSVEGRNPDLYTRYFYGLFLSNLTTLGHEDRAEDVKSLLDVLFENEDRSLSFFNFLRLLGEDETNTLQRSTLNMVRVDDRMGDLLREIGWKI
ncbi:MAG: hypothetical protein QF858_03930 [Candidatus Pacebacteria bacterium]|jgi:hypothetical protein|nr:hypothetical protein [bacterium]MDP6527991.1 hypothetical protein [Candidatus Paceibacterota bacterium]MDP6659751.1 hypothetical protein [Candidatus Paceibacterota bacterium]|tara:strand:+ start:4873 stop:6042 length:1170 start_codon:yes stop_codon:yes gene_type:complete